MRSSSILVKRGRRRRDVTHASVGRARHKERNHAVESPLIRVLNLDLSVDYVRQGRTYRLLRKGPAVNGEYEPIGGHTEAACCGRCPRKSAGILCWPGCGQSAVIDLFGDQVVIHDLKRVADRDGHTRRRGTSE